MALPILAKGAIGLLLLVASQYHYWSRLSSGSVFAPEMPRLVIVLFNWAIGVTVLLAALALGLDLAALCGSLLARHAIIIPDSWRFAIAAVAALLAARAVANALALPAIRDVEVAIPRLAPEFEGYRLLQLTDLHISRLFAAAWVRRLVARANASGVDLMVVTGDFIDGSVAMRRTDVAPLRELRAPDGLYAVPGNHEYFFDYEAWIRHLESLGIRLLENAHAVIERGSGRLVLAGVTDASAAAPGQRGPDLAAALARAPRDAPIILLDHQPRHARAAAARGVALQLSGHTHGGMVLGLDRLVARANGGFVSGRYTLGAMVLYVSNGTGIWPGFALRLGHPAELTRITLRRAG